jgi:hypothetical protein
MFVTRANAPSNFQTKPAPAINQPLLKDDYVLGNRTAEPLIFAIPQPPKVSFHFQVLQQWEGTVIGIEDESIIVRLRDLAGSEVPEKRATISRDEVSDSDHNLIRVGAIFYWVVGYRIELHGQKSIVSTVKFRRLPSWTRRELKRVEDRASEFDIFFEE